MLQVTGLDAGRGGDAGDVRAVAGGAGKQWHAEYCEHVEHCAAVDGHSRSGAGAGEYELPGELYLWREPGSGAAVFIGYFGPTPATTVYAGDNHVQSIETPSGQKLQVNVPGSAIFGSGGSAGILTALNQLIADFQSGTANASTISDTSALTAALSQVSSQRSVLDSSLSRLQQTSTYTQTDEDAVDRAAGDAGLGGYCYCGDRNCNQRRCNIRRC